eukprot:10277849-Alexandrium_andersonii.AAC.1
MSASLVGSEMCIRDRSLASLGSSGSSGIVEIVANGDIVGIAGIVGLGFSCLLYTSDAADDMQ